MIRYQTRGHGTEQFVDLAVRNGHAWVIAVGDVDVACATVLAAAVRFLVEDAAVHRVNVDFTCAVPVDALARSGLDPVCRTGLVC